MESKGDIVLRHGVKNFVPGETVSGEAVWMSEGPVELRLFWFTEGRGTQDLAVEERQEFPANTIKGEFSLVLPSMPFSFEGSLVAVKWALELVDENEETLASEGIIVSPTASEIVLPSIDSQLSSKAEKRRKKLAQKLEDKKGL